MEKVIIGLHGFAGTGKDTVGDILASQGFKKVSFAAPIHRATQAVFDLPNGYTYDRQAKEEQLPGFDFTCRDFMQRLGTEFARYNFGDDFWIKLIARYIFHNDLRQFVITDVRFKNEASWIRSIGGEIWHIKRPGYTPINKHISDAGIKKEPIDREINNNGSVKDLEKLLLTPWRQTA